MNIFRRFRLASPRQLRELGVLGMNRRNAEFVLPGNPRAHYPRVDDKLQTKRLCEAHGIPVPTTYGVVGRQADVRGFAGLVADRRDFVIKPARGAEGRGIVVVAEHDGTTFTTSAGQTLAASDVRYHLANTLSGLYSLEGLPDRAIVEQRIVRHEAFAAIAVGGTPDIRIILYRRVPAMAMVRLPTVASRGRANLHQGAVAAGVQLRTGETFGGVCHDRAVAAHPDTGAPVAGVRVPAWPALLTAAMTLADVLAMDYIGIDFVLDARSGPVVLEANARPGLAIQIANRRGLLPRLHAIEAAGAGPFTVEERLAIVAALPGLDDDGV